MSGKGYQIHVPITHYPGNEYYYVICDVCGKKFRKKETVQIQDKFNLQNRLIVCHRDVDRANDQQRPFKAREYKAPTLVRPEQPIQDVVSMVNPNSDQAPGIVSNLIATADPLTSAIDLWWIGPVDGGSDPVTGYVIYQSWPQLSFPQVICYNTLSGSPSYQDTVTPITASCTYQVAAINAYGTGPLSAVAFFPNIQVNQSQRYICMSNGSNAVLQTGTGLNIIMSGTNG